MITLSSQIIVMVPSSLESFSLEFEGPWTGVISWLHAMRIRSSTTSKTMHCSATSPRPWLLPVSVRIMPSLPSFSSISSIYCKTSCPKHNVKRHNYALTITTTTRGTCLWSRYPVLVIIRELEDLTSRPSVAS